MGIAWTTSGFEQIGDTCYLTRRVNTLTGKTTYHVHANPGTTNLSREPRESGWLGTTNDVASYAEGKVVLTAWVGDEGRVRFRRLNHPNRNKKSSVH